jgi:hypothetical protein
MRVTVSGLDLVPSLSVLRAGFSLPMFPIVLIWCLGMVSGRKNVYNGLVRGVVRKLIDEPH